MKNKLISIILCISIFLSLFIFSTISFADDIDKNGAYAYTSSDSTLTIYNDSIMIDKTENTMAEYPWYSYKSAIEHIVIADGVTKISAYAFCREDNLIDVVIPESVTSIGEAAFAATPELKELTISDNVNYIGNSAFGTNIDMGINKNFVCNCSPASYAQDWCLKNYIAFNSPFSENGVDKATITNDAQQYMWSFVPPVDCNVTFYSKCNFDTVGLIYDADNYVYSTNYSTMRLSAIAFCDDVGNDVNFKITTELKANKRYYISTRYKLANMRGNINVGLDFKCLNHNYEYVSIEEDFMTSNYDTVNIHCTQCNNDDYISFSEAVENNYSFCDLNNDGIVNAKDYAIMINQ